MLSLGAPAGRCDQGEYSGKKNPIGKNIKDKKSLAEGWYCPWILAQVFPLPQGNFSKNLPAQLYIDVNPGCSPMKPRANDSAPSLPHPNTSRVTCPSWTVAYYLWESGWGGAVSKKLLAMTFSCICSYAKAGSYSMCASGEIWKRFDVQGCV